MRDFGLFKRSKRYISFFYVHCLPFYLIIIIIIIIITGVWLAEDEFWLWEDLLVGKDAECVAEDLDWLAEDTFGWERTYWL